MRKRIVTSYLLSIVLPIVGFVALVLKFGGEHRRLVAGLLYALGWVFLVIAIVKHARANAQANNRAPLCASAGWAVRASRIRTRLSAVVGITLASDDSGPCDSVRRAGTGDTIGAILARVRPGPTARASASASRLPSHTSAQVTTPKGLSRRSRPESLCI